MSYIKSFPLEHPTAKMFEFLLANEQLNTDVSIWILSSGLSGVLKFQIIIPPLSFYILFDPYPAAKI